MLRRESEHCAYLRCDKRQSVLLHPHPDDDMGASCCTLVCVLGSGMGGGVVLSVSTFLCSGISVRIRNIGVT